MSAEHRPDFPCGVRTRLREWPQDAQEARRSTEGSVREARFRRDLLAGIRDVAGSGLVTDPHDPDPGQWASEDVLDELRGRVAELEDALRKIAWYDCEHVRGLRCYQRPGEFTDDAPDWSERTCGPCIAHRALRD
jgi:hypothetical protein